jgi:hypothetical protein
MVQKKELPKPFDKFTGFNALWYSQHLFVAVYILLVVHGTFLYLEHKWYLKTVYLFIFSYIYMSFQGIFNIYQY